MKLGLLFLVSLFSVGQSLGADCSTAKHPGVTAIAMRDKISPEDSVAFRWWFHLRDAIGNSSRYCLVHDAKDSYVVMSVIGVDTDPKNLRADTAAISFAAISPAPVDSSIIGSMCVWRFDSRSLCRRCPRDFRSRTRRCTRRDQAEGVISRATFLTQISETTRQFVSLDIRC